MESVKKQGSVLVIMFLVAGTCIGGGMLALPVATSFSGFFPSLAWMAASALFMALTGVLFVEANLWLGPGAHISTMTKKLLGPWGQVVSIILYLFVGYASLVAYTSGGGDLALIAFDTLFGMTMVKWVGCAIFAAVFGLVIFCGNWFVGRVNEILFFALLAAYVLLIGGGITEVSARYLLRQDWTTGFYALPLILTIFSYQAVVPSLVLYMNGDGKRLRTGIIGGAVIAFFVYALWQWLVLGVVPLEGAHGLAENFEAGTAAIDSFRFHVKGAWVATVSEFFAFFAIVTSFLGIGLGLFDFLSDGLKISRKGWGRLWLTLLVIIPTYFMGISIPGVFGLALEMTGGFGDAILNGMIPVLMVWSGRYVQKLGGKPLIRGGKLALVLIFGYALLVLGVEIAERIQDLIPIEDLR